MLEILKIKRDINWLLDQIRCLMKKSDLASPLSATEWSPNHSIATGNPYVLDCFVWLNGHVYKSLIDNNTYPPTNDTYWTDLGEGHLLLEELTDWNATTGRGVLLNKPTNTSEFNNNGEDGSSPYATEDYVSNAIPPIQDLQSVLEEGDTAQNNNVNINEIGLWDNYNEPIETAGFAKIYADNMRIWFKNKSGNIIGFFMLGLLSFRKGIYDFNISIPTITGNRTATFQNASGVVAYLSDISANTSSNLVATAWSSNHTSATGNPYLIGTRVYFLGNIYQALNTNDSILILPTNTTYWQLVGPGNLLDQELIITTESEIVSSTVITGDNYTIELNKGDGSVIPIEFAQSFRHIQSSNSTSWVIIHNLGFRPSITVIDLDGDIVNGDVIYNTINQLTLTFAQPIKGEAYLN